MPFFGQEAMIQAEEKGGLDEAEYREARETCLRLARDEGLVAALHEHHLDAFVSLTGGPAWLIDPIHGDYGISGCSPLAAIAGTPHVTVPGGHVQDLPIGVSFFGAALSEPLLLRVAHAFERATDAALAPRFLPRIAPRL
jgi:amidase